MVSSELKCSLCLQMFVKPVTLSCGHTFCKYCLLQFFLRRSLSCGLCSSEFVTKHPFDLKVNVVVNNVCRSLNTKMFLKALKTQAKEMKASNLEQKLLKKYPLHPDSCSEVYSTWYREQIGDQSQMNRLQLLYAKFMQLIEILRPYV